MAVQDLHSLDISEPLLRLFDDGRATRGAVLSLVTETPQINVGDNTVLTLAGRAKGQLLHEGSAKADNGRQITPKPFTTAKLVYSQRVTDEFMRWTEQKQADFVGGLVNNWLTKSMPKDIDTVVIHGMDPFTEQVDTNLSDYMTKSGSSILVPSTGETASALDTDFATAVGRLNGQDIDGIAIAPSAAAKLSTIVEGGIRKYSGLSVMGLEGTQMAGRRAASTPEVGANGVQLIMGDWSKLLLGFAGEASWRVHVAGDPDNTGRDLAGYNEVLIRLETHFGFRVLDPTAFAYIGTGSISG